jgi:hypothetical protein
MKEIDDIHLSGSSTIRALVGMSEQFDKKLITRLFDEQVQNDFSRITDLLNVQFQPEKNYSYVIDKAESLILEFIRKNQKPEILDLYFTLNPIFVRFAGEYLLFEDTDAWEPDAFLESEWIAITSNYLCLGANKISVLFHNSESDNDSDKLSANLNNKKNHTFCNYHIDIKELTPEYTDFINNSQDYIFYSGVSELVKLDNLNHNILDKLSDDYILAKYVARHPKIDEKTVSKLVVKNDLEVNTGLYENPYVAKSVKKDLLNNGVINEDKYPFFERTPDLIAEYTGSISSRESKLSYKEFVQSQEGYDKNRIQYL